MRFVTIIFLIRVSLPSISQSIENIKASFQGGKVFIAYDLTDGGSNTKQKYFLEVYSSHNNYLTPLKMVTGDIGNLTAGLQKAIEWNAASELGNYKGEIAFRIKGSPVFLPLMFKSIAKGRSARRGKNLIVRWEGGNPLDHTLFELFKGTERITTFRQTKNSGQHSWPIPKNLKKGKYILKINTGNENVSSGPFTVKARVPLFIKVTPLVVAGIVAALLPKSSSNNDLPAAPGPK